MFVLITVIVNTVLTFVTYGYYVKRKIELRKGERLQEFYETYLNKDEHMVVYACDSKVSELNLQLNDISDRFTNYNTWYLQKRQNQDTIISHNTIKSEGVVESYKTEQLDVMQNEIENAALNSNYTTKIRSVTLCLENMVKTYNSYIIKLVTFVDEFKKSVPS
jgi:hypothetical protein